MSFKQSLIYLLKLILCGIIFSVGMIVGGMVAALLGFTLPVLAIEMDSHVALYQMLATPLIAFALAILARGMGGGFWARTFTLSFLTWIAYTVNTQLEALIF